MALGGRNLHTFLRDRRMSERDPAAERGAGRSSSSSSTASATAWIRQSGVLGSLFPGLAVAGDWWNRKITSCKISDAHPDYIPVSRRGDGIYKFSSNHSPEQLGSGSNDQRKDSWDTDERRH